MRAIEYVYCECVWGNKGMKKGSIETIIGEMIRGLDCIGPDDEQASGLYGEIDAFMPVDPVLARLHKEYLEANAQHKRLLRERGARDPMAEVAADMLDSARSAVQTRLIELQELREEETREALERSLRARRAGQEAAYARALIEKRNRDKSGDLFFWMVMLYWVMNGTMAATRKKLSAANDFALVSAGGRRRVRYA